MLSLPNIVALLTSSDGYVAEDLIDKLNSQATVYLLAFFAVITGSKQNFGSPLQCMMPAYAVGSWERYYHDYCYIQNELEMMDPDEKKNPDFVDVKNIATKPVYYQWVPYILFLQALFFLLPRLFWKFAGTHLCYGSEIENAIAYAATVKTASCDVREKTTETLAEFVGETLDFRGRKKLCGFSLSVSYVVRKWFMFFIAVFQFIFLHHLIANNDGVGDFLWGWKLLKTSLYSPPNSTVYEYFPTAIRCNVARLEFGNHNNKSTIQCVLMMNFINEKIFLVIYFWLVALIFINLLAAIEATLFLTVASYRRYVAKTLLPSYESLMKMDDDADQTEHYQGQELFDYFTNSLLRTDGLLLLMFVYNHAGGLVTFELTQQLWNISIQPFSSDVNEYSRKKGGLLKDESANMIRRRRPPFGAEIPTLLNPLKKTAPPYQSQIANDDTFPPSSAIEDEYSTLHRV